MKVKVISHDKPYDGEGQMAMCEPKQISGTIKIPKGYHGFLYQLQLKVEQRRIQKLPWIQQLGFVGFSGFRGFSPCGVV